MYEDEYDAYLDGRSEMLRDVIEYMKELRKTLPSKDESYDRVSSD